MRREGTPQREGNLFQDEAARTLREKLVRINEELARVNEAIESNQGKNKKKGKKLFNQKEKLKGTQEDILSQIENIENIDSDESVAEILEQSEGDASGVIELGEKVEDLVQKNLDDLKGEKIIDEAQATSDMAVSLQKGFEKDVEDVGEPFSLEEVVGNVGGLYEFKTALENSGRDDVKGLIKNIEIFLKNKKPETAGFILESPVIRELGMGEGVKRWTENVEAEVEKERKIEIERACKEVDDFAGLINVLENYGVKVTDNFKDNVEKLKKGKIFVVNNVLNNSITAKYDLGEKIKELAGKCVVEEKVGEPIETNQEPKPKEAEKVAEGLDRYRDLLKEGVDHRDIINEIIKENNLESIITEDYIRRVNADQDKEFVKIIFTKEGKDKKDWEFSFEVDFKNENITLWGREGKNWDELEKKVDDYLEECKREKNTKELKEMIKQYENNNGAVKRFLEEHGIKFNDENKERHSGLMQRYKNLLVELEGESVEPEISAEIPKNKTGEEIKKMNEDELAKEIERIEELSHRKDIVHSLINLAINGSYLELLKEERMRKTKEGQGEVDPRILSKLGNEPDELRKKWKGLENLIERDLEVEDKGGSAIRDLFEEGGREKAEEHLKGGLEEHVKRRLKLFGLDLENEENFEKAKEMHLEMYDGLLDKIESGEKPETEPINEADELKEKWDDLKNNIYEENSRDLNTAYNEANDKNKFIVELKSVINDINIDNFGIDNIKNVLERCGLEAENEENQNEFIKLCKEILFKILDEIESGEKPEPGPTIEPTEPTEPSPEQKEMPEDFREAIEILERNAEEAIVVVSEITGEDREILHKYVTGEELNDEEKKRAMNVYLKKQAVPVSQAESVAGDVVRATNYMEKGSVKQAEHLRANVLELQAVLLQMEITAKEMNTAQNMEYKRQELAGERKTAFENFEGASKNWLEEKVGGFYAEVTRKKTEMTEGARAGVDSFNGKINEKARDMVNCVQGVNSFSELKDVVTKIGNKTDKEAGKKFLGELSGYLESIKDDGYSSKKVNEMRKNIESRKGGLKALSKKFNGFEKDVFRSLLNRVEYLTGKDLNEKIDESIRNKKDELETKLESANQNNIGEAFDLLRKTMNDGFQKMKGEVAFGDNIFMTIFPEQAGAGLDWYADLLKNETNKTDQKKKEDFENDLKRDRGYVEEFSDGALKSFMVKLVNKVEALGKDFFGEEDDGVDEGAAETKGTEDNKTKPDEQPLNPEIKELSENQKEEIKKAFEREEKKDELKKGFRKMSGFKEKEALSLWLSGPFFDFLKANEEIFEGVTVGQIMEIIEESSEDLNETEQETKPEKELPVVMEEVKEKIKNGLVKMKKEDPNKFKLIERAFISYIAKSLDSEKLLKEDFGFGSAFPDILRDFGINFNDVGDFKTKDFMKAMGEIYDEVKEGRNKSGEKSEDES